MIPSARRLPNLEFSPSKCRSRRDHTRRATIRQRRFSVFLLHTSPSILAIFLSIARGRSSLEVSKSLKTQHQTTLDSQVVNVERKEKVCIGS
jgi:hypothetical protein